MRLGGSLVPEPLAKPDGTEESPRPSGAKTGGKSGELAISLHLLRLGPSSKMSPAWPLVVSKFEWVLRRQ